MLGRVLSGQALSSIVPSHARMTYQKHGAGGDFRWCGAKG